MAVMTPCGTPTFASHHYDWNCLFLPRRKRNSSKCCKDSLTDTLYSSLGVILISGLWPTREESLCFMVYCLWFDLHFLFAALGICQPCWSKAGGITCSHYSMATLQVDTNSTLWSCSCTFPLTNSSSGSRTKCWPGFPSGNLEILLHFSHL